MATSPADLNSTRPVGETSATDVSEEVKTESRVTSRVVPSARVATTASCWDRAGADCTPEPGKTSIFLTAGSLGESSARPWASHPRRAWAGTLPGWKRAPPSWGTRPSALSSTSEASGVCRSLRRPSTSRVSCWKSASGSKPRKESLNPPLPEGVPWHAPALQPPTLRAATTSWRKLTGAGLPIPATVTASVTVRGPALMASTVSPSLSGVR